MTDDETISANIAIDREEELRRTREMAEEDLQNVGTENEPE